MGGRIENRRVTNNIYDRLSSQKKQNPQEELLPPKKKLTTRTLQKSVTNRDGLHSNINHKELYEKLIKEKELKQLRKERNTPKEKKRSQNNELLRELGINMRVIKPLKDTGMSNGHNGVKKFSPVKREDKKNSDAFIDDINERDTSDHKTNDYDKFVKRDFNSYNTINKENNFDGNQMDE